MLLKGRMSEPIDSRRGLLEDEESNEKHFSPLHQHLQSRKSRFSSLYTVAGLIGAALIFVSGFYSGWRTAYRDTTHAVFSDAVPRVSIGTVEQTFHQDARFMAPPPAHGEPEPIWDTMLPLGLGYVRHPDIPSTENASTISAMHQLHCLYTIRRIYFSEARAATRAREGGCGGSGDDGKDGLGDENGDAEEALESFDNGVDRADHVTHCFEYLRQAVMCNADSSLEPFETPDGGFPGMGFARQCRDYGALKVFAEKWRIMDETSFILAEQHHDLSSSTAGTGD